MNKEIETSSKDISLVNDIPITSINNHILLNIYKNHQILLNKLLLNTRANFNSVPIRDNACDIKFKILEKTDIDLTNAINSDIINLRKQLNDNDDIEPNLNDYDVKLIPTENTVNRVTLTPLKNIKTVDNVDKYFNQDIDDFIIKKQNLIEQEKKKQQEELERKLLEQQQRSQQEQQKQFSNFYNMDLDLNFDLKPEPINNIPDTSMLINNNTNMFNPNMLMDPLISNSNNLRNNNDSLNMGNVNKPMEPSHNIFTTDPHINSNKMNNVTNEFLINDDFEFGDLGDLGNNNGDIDDFNVDDLDPAYF
ncbi:uncharacterized protein HGUI_00992 [Hanseniaspora guilliermondii]|uniref:Uncharacterized protein n=1 Tax=Hanseniaspora guilliermondii TaxID=56406 RepID=A0A1L0AXH9_9ASCO|nr:uncharacterized protein HGUI_00992 [Hanseniaspora guilliermondii]